MHFISFPFWLQNCPGSSSNPFGSESLDAQKGTMNRAFTLEIDALFMNRNF